MRIVSLLPAATDLVVTLGLAGDLVGRTHECDWPPGALEHIPVVTRTSLPDGLSSREISAAVGGAHVGSSLYALDPAALAALDADLILTQELCDACAVSYAQVADAVRVADGAARLVSLEPRTLGEVLGTLATLGALTGRRTEAAAARVDAERRLAAVAAAVSGRPRPRVVVLEWLDPIWPVGHWVPEQVAAAGGTEVLGTAGAHTDPVGWDRVVAAGPEVLVLAPCGFPPERTLAELDVLTARPGWASLPAVRDGRVWVVDGPAYVNRPGPRVVRGVEVLAHVLHGIGTVTGTEAVPVGPPAYRPRHGSASYRSGNGPARDG
ncbi:MAG TPA: ABC transporter substrate-binding protein [Mycobacteriales bacterium]|nr:ABC transporter substrate-binding protein [Mycobacteriales bacterium]